MRQRLQIIPKILWILMLLNENSQAHSIKSWNWNQGRYPQPPVLCLASSWSQVHWWWDLCCVSPTISALYWKSPHSSSVVPFLSECPFMLPSLGRTGFLPTHPRKMKPHSSYDNPVPIPSACYFLVVHTGLLFDTHEE